MAAHSKAELLLLAKTQMPLLDGWKLEAAIRRPLSWPAFLARLLRSLNTERDAVRHAPDWTLEALSPTCPFPCVILLASSSCPPSKFDFPSPNLTGKPGMLTLTVRKR
jgi:hypothetical protein